MVAASLEDAESEEEEGEHFGHACNSSAPSGVNIWEDSIWVESVELTRGLPEGDAAHGAAASAAALSDGVENPFNCEIWVRSRDCLPSENSNGDSGVDVASRDLKREWN